MKKVLALVACFALVACLALPMFAEDDLHEFTASTAMSTVILPANLVNDASFTVVGTKGSNSYVSLTLQSRCFYHLQLIGIYFDDPSGSVEIGLNSAAVISSSSLPYTLPAKMSNDNTSAWPNNIYNIYNLKVIYNSATTYRLVFSFDDTNNLNFNNSNVLNVDAVTGLYYNTSFDLNSGDTLTFSNVDVDELRYALLSDFEEDNSISFANLSSISNGDSIIGTDEFNGELLIIFKKTDNITNVNSTFTSFTVTLTEPSTPPTTDPSNPPSPPSPPEFDDGEGVFSIVGNFFTLVLAVGSGFITWATTGTNFIVLIPLVLFVLVAAILFIRKLVKGV